MKFFPYILAAFVFYSCTNARNKDIKISDEQLDTIKTAPVFIPAKPDLFERAFISGSKEKGNKDTLSMYGITIGNLKIVSGRIVACDPLHYDEYGIPFTQIFPTGEFPVQLSIAKSGDEETVAFGRIKFSDEPVVRWEFALQKDQEPIPVGGKEWYGYHVDYGRVIFYDHAATPVLSKEHVGESEGQLFKEMDNHLHNDWSYSMYSIGEYNLAAFTTGVGDGGYATYIGFDSQGKPCRLLTDFEIFNWKPHQE